MSLSKLVEHIAVGKNWKEIGGDNIVTITEISRDFADKTMVAFESDCCLSSSPLPMFLKDFTPVMNNGMSKSDSEIDMSDTVNTTFNVGDKVYKFGDADVKNVLEVFENGYMSISNYPHRVNYETICHATQDNYELLCRLYPHIQFELPPSPLTGSDLTKIMFERGDFSVVCKCSNESESVTSTHSPLRLIVGYIDGMFHDNAGFCWAYTTPYDHKTNLPLTDDILNKTV